MSQIHISLSCDVCDNIMQQALSLSKLQFHNLLPFLLNLLSVSEDPDMVLEPLKQAAESLEVLEVYTILN